MPWLAEFRERQSMSTNRRNPVYYAALVGEVKFYDPKTATVAVTVFIRADQPQEIGPMPYLSPLVGAGYGQRAYPEVGTQVLVLSVAPDSDEWVCLGGLYNAIEHPAASPALAAGEHEIRGKNGAAFKVANDGGTAGDGRGGAFVGGAGYAKTYTSGGHTDIFDDAGRVISRVTSGGLKTIHSDATNEVSHVAPNVGLGDIIANLGSTNAAARQSDFTSYESSRATANLNDFIAFANLLKNAGTMTAAQLTTVLASLVAGWAHGVTVPGCSSVVRVK